MEATSYYTWMEYRETVKKAGTVINLLEWEAPSAWINIFGSMLFPDNKKKRLSWICKVFLYTRSAMHQQNTRDNIMSTEDACKKSGQDFATLAAAMDGPGNLTSLLFDAQYNDIRLEGKNRLVNGMIVGEVFLRALNSNKNLREIVECYHKNSQPTISWRSILRNLWPQFLPMAHYWGAMATFSVHDGLNLREDIINPDDIFYCQKFRDKNIRDGVVGLVKIAESYLFQGINDFPKRTGPKHPLLDISKMFFVLHPFVEPSALSTK